MTIERRKFLKGAALIAVAPLVGCESAPAENATVALPIYTWKGALGPETLFRHGVASGDPLPDAVILWTRVSPTDVSAPVSVFWEMATDEAFGKRVAAGMFITSTDRDLTVKVDATGLTAGTRYFYRFWLQGRSSAIGRTHTAPEGKVDTLRAAVCSCAHYTSGFYIGYRAIAARDDIDLVFHLGDYIYEGGNGGGGSGNSGVRNVEPAHVCSTLADYRTRYSHHRLDADLQEAHRRHPWVSVWDDHEVANNGWRDGAPAHTDTSHGAWSVRKAAGIQANFEWLPRREFTDGRIWRRLSWGQLADVFMLDTRFWGRDQQTTGSNTAVLTDPARSMLGLDQEKWLFEGLTDSQAAWRILGQQVMMGQLTIKNPDTGVDTAINTDQWDGYQACRDRVFAAAQKAGPGLVVLTGDIHSSWAIDLVADAKAYDAKTGAGAIGVEVVVPGITSSGMPAGQALVDLAREHNPHIKWAELEHRGYAIVTWTANEVRSEWWHIDSVATPGGTAALAKSFVSARTAPHFSPAA